MKLKKIIILRKESGWELFLTDLFASCNADLPMSLCREKIWFAHCHSWTPGQLAVYSLLLSFWDLMWEWWMFYDRKSKCDKFLDMMSVSCMLRTRSTSLEGKYMQSVRKSVSPRTSPNKNKEDRDKFWYSQSPCPNKISASLKQFLA